MGSHGKREYCNDAHKQAYYRQQVQRDQQEEIDRLKAQVTDQARQIAQFKVQAEDQQQEIEEFRSTIAYLKEQVNMEYRYLKDDRERGLISYLKRRELRTPLIERMLSDKQLPARGSHQMYETYLRYYHVALTEEEMIQFKDLWKLMMLERSRDDF